METNARKLARDILVEVLMGGAYANITLDAKLRAHSLKSEDKGLVSALVYGVLNKKALLDWYLEPFIQKKAKPGIAILLELTIYQICFMDRIPTSAAVDEAVKIAKYEGGQATGNFVNAVLRSFMRSTRKNERPKDWETCYSMPKLLLNKMVTQFGGARTGQILESLEVPSKASIRVNGGEEIRNQLLETYPELEPSELSPVGLVAKQGHFANTPEFKSGEYTLQDETSQLVAPMLELKGDEKVLDACAAPGGKSLHIASLLTTGKVYACDLYEHKLKLIMENAERQALTDKIETRKADARRLSAQFPSVKFDRILVDAPCSGIGLIRRKPDIRYRKEASDFSALAALQLEILESASEVLAENGIMVYSTCTIFDQENFQVVEKFLLLHPEMEQLACQHEKTELIKDGCFFITPEQYLSDGFFIAKFKKKEMQK